MSFFLNKIANHALEEFGDNLHRITYVFPTRRAGVYFLRHLQNQKQKHAVTWAPRIYSTGDFFSGLSDLTILGPLDLVFELYDIYRTHVRNYPKNFEEFYPWGKMIISDFDEIDKNLADPETLFRVLREYKELEDNFGEEQSGIQKRYTGFWADLGTVYQKFTTHLRDKNKAYEGMIYRSVANTIKKTAARHDAAKVIFCGFNALTQAEEVVVRYFKEQNLGEIYWDMDRYFTDDQTQEAGHFFRQNKQNLIKGDALWVEDDLAKERTINIIGVPSKVSQAKVLGLMLEKNLENHEKIAVVMPDETLLFPVLNSLPEKVEKINITIGFPLQQTPAYSLFDTIIEAQLRVMEIGTLEGGPDSREGFYYKDVRKILTHPYIKPLAFDEINTFMSLIKEKNLVYVKPNQLPESLEYLFAPGENSKDMLQFFLDLINRLREFYGANSPDLLSVDYEYLYHFYTLLSRLQESLSKPGLEMSINSFRQLFSDVIRAERISFTGEPLEGLQIMGMLETQTLDFSDLFILSVNEGSLPPGKSQQSFIPFDVRTSLGLPTYRERDAISAYHFYRLLKNTRNATLFYTTETGGMEKSEKSRFIDQLLIEFAERNPQTTINHTAMDFSFDNPPATEISVKKSPEVIEALSNRGYSASSLLTYLACPLRFYFSYVLKIREEEDVYENPDQRMVGTIIHACLEKLYQPFIGKEKGITEIDFDTLREKVEQIVEQQFIENAQTKDLKTGRNRITLEVMKEFLDKFLEKEKNTPGVKILMLEKEIKGVKLDFSSGGSPFSVSLNGHVDRLDLTADHTYRIIDYKTGKIKSLNLKSLWELTGPDAAEQREVFQLFFYRFLLTHVGYNQNEFMLGIYPFKRIHEKLKFVTLDKSQLITGEMVGVFKEVLQEIFAGLFDKELSFTQTQDEKRCTYCPYIDICARKPAEFSPV